MSERFEPGGERERTDASATNASAYQPGVCNIGRRQKRRRYAIAAVAFAVAGVYLLGWHVSSLPAAALFGLFVPLAVGVEWFVQAKLRFCVWLALLNRYDFSPGGRSGRVSAESNRRADEIHAAKITVASVVVATVLTCLAVFVAEFGGA